MPNFYSYREETDGNSVVEPRIEFEPARHPVTREDYMRVEARWNMDWYNTHIWNSETAQRITDNKPIVLGIDGVPYNTEFERYRRDYSKLIWKIIPASPEQINNDGVIYVPTVDFGLDYVIQEHEDDYVKQLAFLQKVTESYDNAVFNAIAPSSISFLFGIGLMGLFLKEALKSSQRSNQDREFSSQDISRQRNRMSRRSFLLGLASTTAVATATTTIAPLALQRIFFENLASHTDSPAIKDVFMNMHQTFSSIDNFHNHIIDGRTAAMIQRTEETMRLMGIAQDKKGIVLCGSNHMHDGKILLSDQEKRLEAMDQMIADLSRFADETASILKIDPKGFRSDVLSGFSMLQVYKIEEPKRNPQFPDIKSLEESIHLFQSFESESTKAILEKYL